MKLIPSSVTRSVARKVLQTKKNSPHIFFAVGVVGVVGSAVYACKQTLKLEAVLDGIKEEVEGVKHLKEENESKGVEFTDNDYQKEMGKVYGHAAVRLTKLYGPPVIIGAASIACLAGSHVQLTRRNAALTAAFGSLSAAFEEYRSRVREELGDEKEREIYHNIKEVEASESGEVSLFKAENGLSPYAQLFDESNIHWVKSAEHNRITLLCQQQYANDRLHAYGHVFLNEVLDWLGFEHTPAGSQVGWIRNGDGDGYIDFGMFETNKSNREYSVWLDFNVDGIIWDKI